MDKMRIEILVFVAAMALSKLEATNGDMLRSLTKETPKKTKTNEEPNDLFEEQEQVLLAQVNPPGIIVEFLSSGEETIVMRATADSQESAEQLNEVFYSDNEEQEQDEEPLLLYKKLTKNAKKIPENLVEANKKRKKAKRENEEMISTPPPPSEEDSLDQLDRRLGWTQYSPSGGGGGCDSYKTTDAPRGSPDWWKFNACSILSHTIRQDDCQCRMNRMCTSNLCYMWVYGDNIVANLYPVETGDDILHQVDEWDGGRWKFRISHRLKKGVWGTLRSWGSGKKYYRQAVFQANGEKYHRAAYSYRNEWTTCRDICDDTNF